MREKKLVIFDFDGVIYDSEPLHFKSFNYALKPLKVEITKEVYYKTYCSYDDKGFFKNFLEDNQIPNDKVLIDKLIKEKHFFFDKNFDSETSIYSGSVELVKRLSKRYVLGIGSGARREEIVRVLKREGLLSNFEEIVSSDETTYPKPNPETYILLLDRVNYTYQISANECVVIEDTSKGVEAAKNAGMKCFAITNSVGKEFLTNADVIINDYSEITDQAIDNI
ncbi:HAD family phosphatase [bacterium]|jgi:HAD superfamily hydrolase (TIGR01509 family)|nr:HAD family phosphatase [bacterium]MBT3795376.1 HAD family phosphatase [bacterium]MBT4633849.1 HAD family phosphatase [bacterium]